MENVHAYVGEVLNALYGVPTPLPWSELDVPEYRVGKYNGWALTKSTPPLIRGYFRGLQRTAYDNYVLSRADEVWMSLTPMELESAMPHVAAANGHVVIMGLGMGLVLFNVLLRPQVHRVTVVEHDKSVIRFMKRQGMLEWPGFADKCEMIAHDALSWTTGEQVDTLLVDIWPNIGDMRLRPDCQRICNNVHPTVMAAWGMELDFVSWLSEMRIPPDSARRNEYRAFCRVTDLPLIEQDSEVYPQLALDAARNVIQY